MLDVQTLGQAFLDWAYEEEPEWYADEDGKPEYYVEYEQDNVNWSAIEELFYSWQEPVVKTVNGSEVQLLEQFGGEGDGEKYYMIFRVENPNGTEQFFRVDGYYTSYYGVNWEGTQLREVYATPRTVVFYE